MLALVVAIAACGGSSGGQASTTAAGGGEELEITIENFAFSGAGSAAVGDTITITNEDSVGHTWTAVDSEFDSGTLAQGDTFEFTFDDTGEFEYICEIHPQMTGTITVEG